MVMFCTMSWLRRNEKKRKEYNQKVAISVWRCEVAQLSLLFVLVATAINHTESSKILQTYEVINETPIALDTEATNVLGNAPEIFNYSHNDGNDKAYANDCASGSSACSHQFSFSEFTSIEKEVVEQLIKKWAPIVWLAPEEKFMPLGVDEFLEHVHPIDKDKTFIPGMPIGDRSERAYLVTNAEIDELLKNESSFIYGRNPNKAPVPIYAVVTLCNGFTEKAETTRKPEQERPLPDAQVGTHIPRGPYIPVSFDIVDKRNESVRRSSRLYPGFKKVKFKRSVPNEIDIVAGMPMEFRKDHNHFIREHTFVSKEHFVDEIGSEGAKSTNVHIINFNSSINAINNSIENTENVNNFIANLADNVKFSPDIANKLHNFDDENMSRGDLMQLVNPLQKHMPAFHVTYWMFYPYSQGKTMCTLDLGPLGHIPFPALYGFCLGRRKDIGSHIGDWEHMSLYFNGAAEPEALYVSAHDAGAYYIFNSLTGSFEYKKQETRKGILQRPNFPKTVTTFNNHPVLFAAKGSHGLWTAPGKHRFVKVARLYDINGFGTLWNTRKAMHISYENVKSYGRSLSPTWLAFKGKWGNPKSKCHPFRRIGLNFCEYTDGPTGIPLKKSHFECGATYRSYTLKGPHSMA